MDQQQRNPEQEYHGNKYRIKSVLFSLSITFLLIILVPVFLYVTNNPILYIGGDLLLRLTRIAYLIIATPVAIVTLFVGHRIDDTRNKVTMYPIWVELIGLITGLFLGWTIAAGWSLLLTIALGTIWADPFLYTPFPIFTALFTYLCFKGAQFIYALRHKTTQKESFQLPLLFFIFSLPVLLYTVLAFITLIGEASSQTSILLTNFNEIPQQNNYLFTADLTVAQSALYHITASVGSTPHQTTPLALRLNGVANIDGLYNFELTKGVNQITYHPSIQDCAFTQNATFSSYVTFTVNKMVEGRFTIGQPRQITIPITCHK